MKLENLIQASIFTPTNKGDMGLNLCLMGDVGIAKTSKVGQVADLYKLRNQLLYGGRSGPQDLVVYLPKETDQGYVNSPCISDLVKKLDKNSILFSWMRSRKHDLTFSLSFRAWCSKES